jgi:hypothetical protein
MHDDDHGSAGVLPQGGKCQTRRLHLLDGRDHGAWARWPQWCEGYENDDWTGAGPYETIEERWTITSPRTDELRRLRALERQAYAMGKVEAEQYAYRWGVQTGMQSLPRARPADGQGVQPHLAEAHQSDADG